MSGEAPPLRWLELVLDYRCNQRCRGCFAVAEDGASMDAAEISAWLRRGRALGIERLWFGGGEPTLRRDLFGIAKVARGLGYTRIRVQTNGMLFAYEDFARRAAEAGVTELSLSLKAASAELHDALTRTDGSFELLVRGIEQARAQGLALEGDVLVYASTVHALPDIVETFHRQGLARFRLWAFAAASGASGDAEALTYEVPSMSALVAAIEATASRVRTDDPRFLVSLHTPPCVLPSALRARVRFDARGYGLFVANPSDRGFRLEDAPMEGGTYLEGCAGCAERARCGGIRAEYLALHGASSFVPLAR